MIFGHYCISFYNFDYFFLNVIVTTSGTVTSRLIARILTFSGFIIRVSRAIRFNKFWIFNITVVKVRVKVRVGVKSKIFSTKALFIALWPRRHHSCHMHQFFCLQILLYFYHSLCLWISFCRDYLILKLKNLAQLKDYFLNIFFYL